MISLSFASIKDSNYEMARRKICQILTGLYSASRFLLEGELLDDKEKRFFASVSMDMDDVTAILALHELSGYLSRYYGKKVVILLDEYDTPMQDEQGSKHYVFEYDPRVVYGFGRYDVMLEPRNTQDDAVILECKVQDAG